MLELQWVGASPMNSLLQDVRFALRQMRRERAFTVVVVATLALAIGATTAVFSVVYQVLLRPLPYPAPERILRLFQSEPQRERLGVTVLTFREWRERVHSFESIEGASMLDYTLTDTSGADRITVARASAGLLPLLGVRPTLGRVFDAEAETLGHEPVVLLSNGLWKRRFGERREVVGQSILLDGRPHTVLGVLPPTFRFIKDADAWAPLVLDPARKERPQDFWMRVVGRLRPGVTAEQAGAELKQVMGELVREPLFADQAAGAVVMPLRDVVVESYREQLWLLAGIMALVLLVACANVANLLLARANAREREVSVRAALGAGPGRLVRQFLVESGLLALVGGGAGLLLALWGLDLMRALVPAEALDPESVRLNGTVLAIAALLSLLTSVLFGLVPALRAARADARGALGGLRGGRGSTGGGRALAVLVVAQVALALMPLVGAGLMLRTLHALQSQPLGFEPRNVRVAEVYLPRDKYPEEAQKHQLFTELLERVKTMPGVQSASLASTVPLWGRSGIASALLPGEPDSARTQRPFSWFKTVTLDYFTTLGIRVKEGRGFEPTDGPGAPPVMMVNETFARMYFPGSSALGQRARLLLEGETIPREVVGVVGDIRAMSLEDKLAPEVYLPMNQYRNLRMLVLVRSASDTAGVAPALREHLRAVAPDVPLGPVRDMQEVVYTSLASTRLLGSLLSAIAVLGLCLAGMGLYGVLAYSVSQRTRELGIRMALGATSSQVLGLVVGQGLRMALVGGVLGLVGAALLARGLSGLLHGVEPFDALTFTAVPLLLGAVALLACWLPARRALRVPPQEALRAEG